MKFGFFHENKPTEIIYEKLEGDFKGHDLIKFAQNIWGDDVKLWLIYLDTSEWVNFYRRFLIKSGTYRSTICSLSSEEILMVRVEIHRGL